jgi:hypothetical protein
VVFLFAVVVGVRGVDFGFHWDENKILKSVANSIETATLLPGWYNYPSLSYGIALAAVVPEAVSALAEARSVIAADTDKDLKKDRLSALSGKLASVAFADYYKIRVRTIFVVLSMLSIIWVYVFVYLWRRRWWEALVAAIFLGTSWEVGYHARWIAPDAILMQFTALSLVTLFSALRSRERRLFWLCASAVVAGLACGTKYNGALLLVPVLVVAATTVRENDFEAKRAPLFVWPVLLFAATFLLTTPGAMVQPFRFLYDVLGEMRHYQTGHGEHSIAPGFVHAYRMGEYLSMAAFSRYWPGAVLVFGLALAGGWAVLRHHRRMAVVLLLVPVVYFVYMSAQRVMVVRNLMVLLPFLAILAARGLALIVDRVPERTAQIAVGAVVLVLMAANGAWLVTAAESIADRGEIDHRRNIARYLLDKPEQEFFLSYGAYGAIRSSLDDYPNVTVDRGQVDRIMILTSDLGKWYGNRWGVYDMVSGSFEVNLEYYPSWRGDAKVFAVSPQAADKMWFEPPSPDEAVE